MAKRLLHVEVSATGALLEKGHLYTFIFRDEATGATELTEVAYEDAGGYSHADIMDAIKAEISGTDLPVTWP